jgi:hypothetical protein
MAKTIRAFGGTNSYGVSVEVAESESGNWFQRSWSYNGYGRGWDKWTTFTPNWSTSYVNVYTLETHEREAVLEYGFSTLQELKDTPRYRLPY